ncbi:uncharacterized protein [Onthophagus taurus]|uniref:uncharacterized protein n=1 Tax=Onthophagus taurus TaxID=166361 RepID=UPI0039BE8466
MLDLEVLENLRCSTCHNFLCVLPIYSYGGEQNICGRCPIKEEFAPQRAILYETVIKNLEFPCQFEMRGCPEKIIPEAMEAHELICSFRPIYCPQIEKCEFQGAVEEISTHFEDEHPDGIFKNVEIDVVNSYERNYIFWEGNDTFVIALKCITDVDEKLFVQVKYLNNEKSAGNFNFNLQFTNKHKDFFNITGKVVYSEKKSIEAQKDYETILIKDLLTNLNHPAIIFSNIKMIRSRPSVQRVVSQIESNLLLAIECPVCFCHMTPPILQCTRGHSFCKPCHAKLEICPICRQSMSDTQNFLLENLTLKIDYPCKFQQFNCQFYGSVDKIHHHEKICSYQPTSCILNDCDWNNTFPHLLEHLKTSHHDEFLDVTTITYFVDLQTEEPYNYVISKFGNIFKVVFKEDQDCYKWCLQLIGPDVDPSMFVLELDIKSAVNFERVYYKKKCNPPITIGEEFIDRDSYVKLNKAVLKGMIVDNLLIYYCNVAQI